jgi:coniferyl-aldehyde dehydrogenase
MTKDLRSDPNTNAIPQQRCCGPVSDVDLYQHYLQEDLPFGGVGDSGMGAYHGRDGFIETSHARAVFRQAPGVKPSPTLSAPFAPEIMELFQREITARKTAGSH